jgi:SEC-C motif-containing protein
MRSRFSAYALGRIDYIERTSGGPALAAFSRRDAEAWANAATFTKLEVLATEQGTESDDEGLVDFAATYIEAKKTHVLRERSRFARTDGAWRYIGAAPQRPVTAAPKAGRNAPCPCGSGLKFKKCCG